MRSLIYTLQDHWRRFLSARHSSSVNFEVRMAALRFRRKRGDYYGHLAETIERTQGKKKLRQIFADDSDRYGRKPRGVLSRYWSAAYEKYGGRYGKVFEGTLPNDEVMLLRLIQTKGGDDILPQGLRDMAETVALLKKANDVVRIAVLGFIFPMLITLLSLATVPLFSVPKLREMGSDMPEEALPISVQQLYGLAGFLTGNLWVMVIAALLLLTGTLYSFSRLHGPVRWFLDKYGLLWSIHRDFEAVKFLSNLSLVIKTRNSKSDNLRESLQNLSYGANPWKADVIRRMLENLLQRGSKIQDVFKVGLLGDEAQYELEDLITARGLNEALEYLRPRLEDTIVKRLQLRCKILMWSMIAASTAISLDLFLNQTFALQDLQQAVARFYFN
jgi:hypothetical protein